MEVLGWVALAWIGWRLLKGVWAAMGGKGTPYPEPTAGHSAWGDTPRRCPAFNVDGTPMAGCDIEIEGKPYGVAGTPASAHASDDLNSWNQHDDQPLTPWNSFAQHDDGFHDHMSAGAFSDTRW